jgi:hypothetical protein
MNVGAVALILKYCVAHIVVEPMETDAELRKTGEISHQASNIFTTAHKAKHMAKRYREIKQLAPVSAT